MSIDTEFDFNGTGERLYLPAYPTKLPKRCTWWRELMRKSHTMRPVTGQLLAQVRDDDGRDASVDELVPMLKCAHCQRSVIVAPISVGWPGASVRNVSVFDRVLSPDEIAALYQSSRKDEQP